MKVAIIGTGNLAWHLTGVLEEAGCSIELIYGRDIAAAKLIAKQAYAPKVTNRLDFENVKAELFFLCVSDAALEDILDQIVLPDGVGLVHCSGTSSIQLLENYAENQLEIDVNTGVFYPLMTLKKNVFQDFQGVPICIEATSSSFEDRLVHLAQQISKIVYSVTSKERLILHMAAVFSNNFVNHLLAVTQNILEKHDLDLQLILPILEKTFDQAVNGKNLAQLQTGPASRNDVATMKKHLTILDSNPEWQNMYKSISKSITSKEWL
jgi:predicted short-subunit dehydrogenase-like oxidoreductase (DUF2520 family)